MTENIAVTHISDHEIWIGECRAKLIEDDIIHVLIVGPQSTLAAYALYNATQHLAQSIEGKVSYLIDLNKAGKNSPEASRLWKRAAEGDRIYKVAQFGLHPVVRVLASFVNNLTSKQNIRFFNSMQEGLKWIRE